MECDSGAAEEARTPNTRAERLVKESAVRASELNTSLNAAALSGAFSGRSRHTEARTEPCKDSESANLPAGETDLVTGAPESLPPSGKILATAPSSDCLLGLRRRHHKKS